MQANVPDGLARPTSGSELRETLRQLVGSPNLADKSYVTNQYDRYVQGNTVLAQPADSGMVRIDENSGRGVAISTDCNGRFALLDPYAGAQLALAEAYRNVATTGAKPLAVTDCLNFGSPEDPSVMWQFERAVTGLADACLELGVPVTGGNVSFYNQTGDVAILPTPVVGVLGVIDDVATRTRLAWSDGDAIIVLGATRDEFGGSEWAHVVHGHLGGLPPKLDLNAERSLAEALVSLCADGLLSAAHDVSDGGIAQTLFEMGLESGVGSTVVVPTDLDPFVFLFAESASRAVVAAHPDNVSALLAVCESGGVPAALVGSASGSKFVVADQFEVELADLRAVWESVLPALFS